MKSIACLPSSARVILWIAFLFLYSLPGLQAQDTLQMVELKTKEGSTIIGTLIEETSEKIVILSQTMGEMTILRANLISYRKIRPSRMVNGVYWHENPNPTRNIYGPTGYGLRKGEGYYQNFMIFLHQVSYGFTDQFTLGVGIEIASLLFSLNDGSDSSFPGFTITPKFSFPIKEEQWNVGVGALALHVPFTDELFSAGILYGVSTWGSSDNNFTIGMGFGMSEGQFTGRPTITISGNARTGRRFGLVTENWFIPLGGEYGALISVGARYIGERLTWDFALYGAGGGGGFFISPLPLVGLSIPFGTGWKS